MRQAQDEEDESETNEFWSADKLLFNLRGSEMVLLPMRTGRKRHKRFHAPVHRS
jgi:hypothetical protein